MEKSRYYIRKGREVSLTYQLTAHVIPRKIRDRSSLDSLTYSFSSYSYSCLAIQHTFCVYQVRKRWHRIKLRLSLCFTKLSRCKTETSSNSNDGRMSWGFQQNVSQSKGDMPPVSLLLVARVGWGGILGRWQAYLFLEHEDKSDRREGHMLSCYPDSREGLWKKENRNGTALILFCAHPC